MVDYEPSGRTSPWLRLIKAFRRYFVFCYSAARFYARDLSTRGEDENSLRRASSRRSRARADAAVSELVDLTAVRFSLVSSTSNCSALTVAAIVLMYRTSSAFARAGCAGGGRGFPRGRRVRKSPMSCADDGGFSFFFIDLDLICITLPSSLFMSLFSFFLFFLFITPFFPFFTYFCYCFYFPIYFYPGYLVLFSSFLPLLFFFFFFLILFSCYFFFYSSFLLRSVSFFFSSFVFSFFQLFFFLFLI